MKRQLKSVFALIAEDRTRRNALLSQAFRHPLHALRNGRVIAANYGKEDRELAADE